MWSDGGACGGGIVIDWLFDDLTCMFVPFERIANVTYEMFLLLCDNIIYYIR